MPKQPLPNAREIAAVFAALSQETRLEAYRLLLRYQPFGLAAGDISRLLSVPHNTLSTHMRALEAAGLVRSRKEGRSVIFAADRQPYDRAAEFLGLTPMLADSDGAAPATLHYPSKRPASDGAGRPYNVLILCAGNSARSLIAEAIVNRESGGRFRAFSAGSMPKNTPHPLTIKLLGDLGYDTSGLTPKSWDVFAEQGAPEMDFVITVCDRAQGEVCPSWPGHPLTAHWGIPSIAELAASDAESEAAFRETYRGLMNRFTAFINLPVETLPLDELKRRIGDIASLEGATEKALALADA